KDVVDTLELLYSMPRPFNLLIFSLKVIPNTDLEQAMRDRGIDLEEINSSYLVIPPRAGNLLLYLLTSSSLPAGCGSCCCAACARATSRRLCIRASDWCCGRCIWRSARSATCAGWISRSPRGGSAMCAGASDSSA